MKFELSDDQALLRSSTRDFLTSEFPLEKSRGVMEHSKEGYDPAEWRRLAEMGYLGLVLPARVGGQGLGAVELAVVLEEMDAATGGRGTGSENRSGSSRETNGARRAISPPPATPPPPALR